MGMRRPVHQSFIGIRPETRNGRKLLALASYAQCLSKAATGRRRARVLVKRSSGKKARKTRQTQPSGLEL